VSALLPPAVGLDWAVRSGLVLASGLYADSIRAEVESDTADR